MRAITYALRQGQGSAERRRAVVGLAKDDAQLVLPKPFWKLVLWEISISCQCVDGLCADPEFQRVGLPGDEGLGKQGRLYAILTADLSLGAAW